MEQLKNHGCGRFLVQSNNSQRDSYIWNMLAGMLFAFQSVILLVILTRTVGLVDAGIFTIAYANASLFLLIGKYGVRNYQVSDAKKQHSFGDYRRARIITVGAMFLVSAGYLAYSSFANAYSLEKSLIIFLMCIFKMPDAIEDVYFGEYQQRGRLDIASKATACRLGLTIAVFAAAVIFTKSLLIALLVSTVLSFIIMILFLKWTSVVFEMNFSVDNASVKQILQNCFPLFAGAFLSQYIGNAPKYAIDAQLSDDLQACYGFISMPVFVIGLLSGFIFSPIIHKMSEHWTKRRFNIFLKRTLIQIGIVILITVICIIGAWLIGIPVLSLLYNTDLQAYKKELLVLLVGGGFLGLSGLLSTIITIMRFQKALFWGYSAVSLCALILSNQVVASYGMIGAAWLYTALMASLFVFFVVIFMVGLMRRPK